MQCVPSEPSEGLGHSNMAYYAEVAVSSHESIGSVYVYVSACQHFGVCPPFVDSFCMHSCLQPRQSARLHARIGAVSEPPFAHSFLQRVEGLAVTGGWMKYLAVACFKKNNRCFVLLISTLARGGAGREFFFFFFLSAAGAAVDWLVI